MGAHTSVQARAAETMWSPISRPLRMLNLILHKSVFSHLTVLLARQTPERKWEEGWRDLNSNLELLTQTFWVCHQLCGCLTTQQLHQCFPSPNTLLLTEVGREEGKISFGYVSLKRTFSDSLKPLQPCQNSSHSQDMACSQPPGVSAHLSFYLSSFPHFT